MKLGEAILSGVIGSIFGLIATWFVFGIFNATVEITNVYIFVGIAGFFGSFASNWSLVGKTKECKGTRS
jgi:hypothetical protein